MMRSACDGTGTYVWAAGIWSLGSALLLAGSLKIGAADFIVLDANLSPVNNATVLWTSNSVAIANALASAGGSGSGTSTGGSSTNTLALDQVVIGDVGNGLKSSPITTNELWSLRGMDFSLVDGFLNLSNMLELLATSTRPENSSGGSNADDWSSATNLTLHTSEGGTYVRYASPSGANAISNAGWSFNAGTANNPTVPEENKIFTWGFNVNHAITNEGSFYQGVETSWEPFIGSATRQMEYYWTYISPDGAVVKRPWTYMPRQISGPTNTYWDHYTWDVDRMTWLDANNGEIMSLDLNRASPFVGMSLKGTISVLPGKDNNGYIDLRGGALFQRSPKLDKTLVLAWDNSNYAYLSGEGCQRPFWLYGWSKIRVSDNTEFEGGNNNFRGDLGVTGGITLGGVRRTSWPSAGIAATNTPAVSGSWLVGFSNGDAGWFNPAAMKLSVSSLSAADASFSGSNYFAGPVLATNAANHFVGKLQGDASGATNLVLAVRAGEFAGPTNSVAMGLDTTYTAFGDVGVTNVTGVLANQALFGTLAIYNRSGSNATLNLPSGWLTPDGARSYTLTNAVLTQLSVRCTASFTNASVIYFY